MWYNTQCNETAQWTASSVMTPALHLCFPVSFWSFVSCVAFHFLLLCDFPLLFSSCPHQSAFPPHLLCISRFRFSLLPVPSTPVSSFTCTSPPLLCLHIFCVLCLVFVCLSCAPLWSIQAFSCVFLLPHRLFLGSCVLTNIYFAVGCALFSFSFVPFDIFMSLTCSQSLFFVQCWVLNFIFYLNCNIIWLNTCHNISMATHYAQEYSK